MSVTVVQPRLFGAVPPFATLALGLLGVVAAAVLFATEQWVVGTIVLCVALLALVLFAEAARRRPRSVVERAAATGASRLGERVRLAGGVAGAWSQASRATLRLRAELRRIARERRAALYELGEAVYAEDVQATEALRGKLRELDERTADCVERLQAAVVRANRRIAGELLAVRPTEIIRGIPRR